MMTDAERDLFDVLLEQVIEDLPAGALDEMPYIVDDKPDDVVLEAFHFPHDQSDSICGAFQVFPRQKRTMLQPFRPKTSSQVYLFRDGIVKKAGGWTVDDASTRIAEQIKATMREQITKRFEKEKEDAVNNWRYFC